MNDDVDIKKNNNTILEVLLLSGKNNCSRYSETNVYSHKVKIIIKKCHVMMTYFIEMPT